MYSYAASDGSFVSSSTVNDAFPSTMSDSCNSADQYSLISSYSGALGLYSKSAMLSPAFHVLRYPPGTASIEVLLSALETFTVT